MSTEATHLTNECYLCHDYYREYAYVDAPQLCLSFIILLIVRKSFDIVFSYLKKMVMPPKLAGRPFRHFHQGAGTHREPPLETIVGKRRINLHTCPL